MSDEAMMSTASFWISTATFLMGAIVAIASLLPSVRRHGKEIDKLKDAVAHRILMRDDVQAIADECIRDATVSCDSEAEHDAILGLLFTPALSYVTGKSSRIDMTGYMCHIWKHRSKRNSGASLDSEDNMMQHLERRKWVIADTDSGSGAQLTDLGVTNLVRLLEEKHGKARRFAKGSDL